MIICWQCATKLVSPNIRRSFLRLGRPLPGRRYLSLHQNLTETIRGLPLPPPEVGNIRDRLLQWQEESGNTLVDTISAEVETRKLQTFAAEEEPQDEENIMFGDDMGEAITAQMRHFVLPGSLVEITPRYSVQDPIFAVMIAERNSRYVLFTINGRIVTVGQKKLLWHLPQWINPADLTSLDPYIPGDDAMLKEGEDIKVHDFGVPREASAPIITALNEFRNKIHNIYRRHAAVLDNAHELLADQVELQFGTLTRIAQKLVGASEKVITPEVLYTVRKALHRHPIGFNSLRNVQRRSQLWQVRPKNMVNDVFQARLWLRQYRDVVSFDQASDPRQYAAKRAQMGYKHVDHFVQTCRRLIAETRKSRSFTSSGIGPDSSGAAFGVERRKSGVFTAEDSLFIRFLQYWCLQEAFAQDQSLTGLPAYLIQAIGMYDDFLPSQTTGKLLLQELGCLPTYADFTLLKPELMLPGHGLSARLDSIWNTIVKSSSSNKMEDSMRHLRHDWGNLPVYCIDDKDTSDVDDGISVEPVEDHAEQYWLRIHVANPTAFISPDSNVSAMARQLTSSLYSPESTLHMLPPVYQKICSLKSGAPTLTFSVRVDSTGSILEEDIRSGRVHNVCPIAYSDVDSLLGVGRESILRSPAIIVGALTHNIESQRPLPSNFFDKHKSNLQIIYRLTSALKRKRQSNNTHKSMLGETMFDSVRAFNPDKYPHHSNDVKTTFRHKQSALFQGDPVISFQGHRMIPASMYEQCEPDARVVVSEAMITAGIVAANWSWDRKIAQPYRTQMLRVAQKDLHKYTGDIKAGNTEKAMEDFTWNDALGELKRRNLMLPAFMLARPAHHASLGVLRYTKVTSPLRRYGDMLAHWQIEAALRHEADTGKSLVNSDQTVSVVPFNHDSMDALLSRLLDRENIMRQAQTASNRHWISTLVHRAVYYPSQNQTQCDELTLGMPFIAVVSASTFAYNESIGTRIVPVHSEDHALPVAMVYDPALHGQSDGVEMFDRWEVALDRVLPAGGIVVVRPIRLLSRCDEDALRSYAVHRAQMAEQSAKTPQME